jgi:glycosyltransferase involved in cell wall biosynthesis
VSYIYVLGGDGTCLEAWKKLAQDLGVSARVSFEGKLPRQKIGEWMQVADLHVLPSSYEGFPHVVAEAAILGLPSYVSDRGGNSEIKDIGLLKELLWYQNKKYCGFFQESTGVDLGKTDKSMRLAIDKWGA